MDEGTFTGLGVSRPVADALAERGIKVPFAIQARVIPDGLAGRDVLASRRRAPARRSRSACRSSSG